MSNSQMLAPKIQTEGTAKVVPKILCIDDDPQISDAIAARLSEYNVNVQCAYFGTHGYWIANSESPDLIITDYQMPQGDGAFVVETLRRNQNTFDIPIIVLSGHVSLRSEMLQLGVNEFLKKPVQFESLKEMISRYIPLTKKEWPSE